jgi:hypothetical protein
MGTSGRYINNTNEYFYDYKFINFLTIGQKVGTFSWLEKRTLSQIEKISGYKVKPTGVRSRFKNGGFVVYERDGHGLIAAITDLNKMDWVSALKACDEMISNGYHDWRIPTYDELQMIYNRLKLGGVGSFSNGVYWSSTETKWEGESLFVYAIDFSIYGEKRIGLKEYKDEDRRTGRRLEDFENHAFFVRAVRNF